jgi:hypothetical protein
MKIIKLTSSESDSNIYVNVECIGHMYEVADTVECGKIVKKAYTKVGVNTHRNGGFEVKETVENIVKSIELVRHI